MPILKIHGQLLTAKSLTKQMNQQFKKIVYENMYG